MAAEKDEQKSAEGEARQSGRERRRSPLTIDLTAEAVAAKGGTAPKEAAAGRDPDQRGPAAAATSSAATEQPPSRDSRSPFGSLRPLRFDREAWVGFGSAAALGGVVALILLMVLQSVGV